MKNQEAYCITTIVFTVHLTINLHCQYVTFDCGISCTAVEYAITRTSASAADVGTTGYSPYSRSIGGHKAILQSICLSVSTVILVCPIC